MKYLVLVAWVIVAACSSDSHETVRSGTLTVNLATGGSNDGALVMIISGGPVIAVSAPAGYDIATDSDAAGTHLMITGDITMGTVATITVPDISLRAAYAVTVEQAADRTTFALLDPSGYTATVK